MIKTHPYKTNKLKHNYQTDKSTMGVFLPVVILLVLDLYYVRYDLYFGNRHVYRLEVD